MKKSIAFLPKKNREDLKYLVELILDKIPVWRDDYPLWKLRPWYLREVNDER